jgi:hypothetical protein
VGGLHAESSLLQFQDWIEIRARDAFRTPVADASYTLHLPDGTQREGTLDSDGLAREEDLPPGPLRVEFDTEDDRSMHGAETE